MSSKNTTYNLCSTEREFKEQTIISYYFQRNSEIIKKCSPIDINGERFRIYHDTGEIVEYKKKDVVNSLQASLRRTVILMNMLLAMNDFEWFWTLTFDRAKVDRTNAEVVFNCYSKYIDNLKHQFPNLKYMCFPELHEDGCYHFHLLTAGLTPKQMGLVNSGKVCCHWAKKKYNGICSREFFEQTKNEHTLKETDGEPIYNATSFIYGYTTVSKIQSRERCNSYVKKYVEKALGSTDVFKKRFYYSANLNVPKIVKRIIVAGFDYPKTINTVSKVVDNPYTKNADNQFVNEEHNVMQIRIANDLKKYIDLGLTPTNDEEMEELFNFEQSSLSI